MQCFVLRMDKFLPQCVRRFKVNQDLMFIEDPSEFLRCSRNIGNDDVVTFSHLLLSVCSGAFRGFEKRSSLGCQGSEVLPWCTSVPFPSPRQIALILAWTSNGMEISRDSYHLNRSSSCVLRSCRIYLWSNCNLNFTITVCSEQSHCSFLSFCCSTTHTLAHCPVS